VCSVNMLARAFSQHVHLRDTGVADVTAALRHVPLEAVAARDYLPWLAVAMSQPPAHVGYPDAP